MNKVVVDDSSKVGFLDGLRGFAALWVLTAHVGNFTGLNLPILSAGNVAVDLFMIVSGFLMMHNAQHRRIAEPWEKLLTWLRFIMRRFFRIAPVYYVVLIFGLIVAPVYGGWRSEIAQFFPDPTLNVSRFYEQTIANVFAHIFFVFGALPEFSRQSPGIPDWSIGLEMQFYVA